MKILFDVTAVAGPLSGIGRYAKELAQRLPRHERVESVVFLANGEVVDQFNPNQIEPLPKQGVVRPLLRRWLPYDIALRPYRRFRARKIAGRLEAFDDHVYFSPNFSLPPVTGPRVATVHDLSVFHYPDCHPRDRVNFLKEQIAHSVEVADRLVTDSEFVRSELLELFSVPEDKVFAVPLGVDSAFRPRHQRELAEPMRRYGLEAGKYLLSVGTLEPRKNIHRLIEAFCKLDPHLRKRYPLAIVGAYGWDSESLLTEIRRLEDCGEAIYLDYVPEEDLPFLYAGATSMCYFSLYEGFGLPVLEAMSSGVPVLCSATSSLPELCQDTRALIDPCDVPAITQALEMALTSPGWCTEAGQNGRALSQAYGWDRTVDKLVQVLGEVA